MVVLIKKKATKKEIDAVIKKVTAKKKKGFNPYKHVGKVKWNVDPVEYQRKLRDEWD